jgi:hypothetical protein
MQQPNWAALRSAPRGEIEGGAGQQAEVAGRALDAPVQEDADPGGRSRRQCPLEKLASKP